MQYISLRAIASLLTLIACVARAASPPTWTLPRAQAWYALQPWIVGSNYVPASAINQLEMWQPETFDPDRIDRELAWAQAIGMNTMRVFLHNLLWEEGAEGFKQRIDTFLSIASRHGIKTILVLFDSCWDPEPRAGPQHPPIPGVHNSGWVQSPGRERLHDASRYPLLRAYVEGVVGAFANDQRVLAWDIWNEPDNNGGGNYVTVPDKVQRVAELLPQVFEWARLAHPIQPLTSGLWRGTDWSTLDRLEPIERIQIEQSDIISFHDYSWPESLERRIHQLQKYGKPLICTEFMARTNGSTFDGSLPVGKRLDVGMINWGFVDGKTQTRYPWDSWHRPYLDEQPNVWFHEVLHSDGRPYREREVELIKALSEAPRRVIPRLDQP